MDISPDAWLNLGVPGAALFIILVVILLIFSQQNKNINKLCDKIDTLVSSFTTNNTTLKEVLLVNDKDQKQTLLMLSDICADVKDIQKRVIRIDTRLYQRMAASSKDLKEPREEEELNA